jgi:hypothetical protein
MVSDAHGIFALRYIYNNFMNAHEIKEEPKKEILVFMAEGGMRDE